MQSQLGGSAHMVALICQIDLQRAHELAVRFRIVARQNGKRRMHQICGRHGVIEPFEHIRQRAIASLDYRAALRKPIADEVHQIVMQSKFSKVIERKRNDCRKCAPRGISDHLADELFAIPGCSEYISPFAASERNARHAGELEPLDDVSRIVIGILHRGPYGSKLPRRGYSRIELMQQMRFDFLPVDQVGQNRPYGTRRGAMQTEYARGFDYPAKQAHVLYMAAQDGGRVFPNGDAARACDVIGVERILFSVDFPLVPNEGARAFLENADIMPAVLELIAHGNSERLLNMTAS